MITISRNMRIQAPIDRILDFLGGAKDINVFSASLCDSQDIQQPRILRESRYDWTSKVPEAGFVGGPAPVGRTLYGRLVSQTSSGLKSAVTWTLHSEGPTTLILLHIEYEIPTALLHTTQEQVFIHANEQDVDALLENLKCRAEQVLAHVR